MNRTIKIIAALLLVSFAVIYHQTRRQPPTPTRTHQEPLSHSLKHLGIIMDGNRRWAKEQGQPSWFGHQSGAENAKMAVRFCVEHNIPYLSLYTFSTENFNRSKEELEHLFDLIEKGLSDNDIKDLVGHGVKIKFLGDRSLFPEKVTRAAQRIESATKNGEKLTVNLLFAYGGRLEISSAIKSICTDVQNKKINIEDINEKLINNYLWTRECPDPDLIIRTGNRNRLSNFLTWQNVYSELMFSDKMWPDVTKEDLQLALLDFTKRKRTYGS